MLQNNNFIIILLTIVFLVVAPFLYKLYSFLGKVVFGYLNGVHYFDMKNTFTGKATPIFKTIRNTYISEVVISAFGLATGIHFLVNDNNTSEFLVGLGIALLSIRFLVIIFRAKYSDRCCVRELYRVKEDYKKQPSSGIAKRFKNSSLRYFYHLYSDLNDVNGWTNFKKKNNKIVAYVKQRIYVDDITNEISFDYEYRFV